MALILNQAQAAAVYSAMRALKNVGGKIDRIDLEGSEVRVRENTAGRVFVESMERGEEAYYNQSIFAAAYGLDHGGDKNAAALEQIARLGREGTRDGQIIRDAMTEIAEKATAYGLTQTAIER